MERMLLKVTAAASCSFLAAVLVPACTIHLEQGGIGGNGTDEAQPGSTSGEGNPSEQAGMTGDADSAAEEEATIAALNEAVARADPREVAIADLRTQYAAYALAGAIEAHGGDPVTMDQAALQHLLDQIAPGVWEQAGQWAQSLDPATAELATITVKEDCVNKWSFGCERKEYCDFDNNDFYGICVVTGCGEGRCPLCPRLFNLDRLIEKGWCTYSCVWDKKIVGIKIIWHFAIYGSYDKCMLLEAPIPVEN